MSPKSEENIKKKTNAKVNLKISRKKSKPTTEHITYAKISSLKNPNKVSSKEVKPEKKKEKRVIKSIKAKNVSKPKKEEPTVVEEVKKAPKVSKKTLKLNINSYDSNAQEKRTFTPDTSVNQNSSFFYSPSVFQKFGISITDISNDKTDDVKQDISENDVNQDISENNVKQDIPEEDKIKAVAENIVPVPEETTASTASIEKIKNTIATSSPSLSTVFKTFSYDETKLINVEKPQISTNNIETNTPKATVTPTIDIPPIQNTVSGTFTNNDISIDMNSIDFADTPIQTIEQNIVKEPQTQSISNVSFETEPIQTKVNTEVKEITTQDLIDNVENEVNLKLDDELIQNLLEENIDIRLDEDITENNEIEENNEEINEKNVEKDSTTDNDNMFNIEPKNNENTLSEEDYTNYNYEDYNVDEENDDFSIEEYFGLTDIKPEKEKQKKSKKKPLLEEIEELDELNEDIDEDLSENVPSEDSKKSIDLSESELSSLSQLFDTFTEKISSLSNRISELENSTTTPEVTETVESNYIDNFIEENAVETEEINDEALVQEEPIQKQVEEISDENIDNNESDNSDINIDDISLEDLGITLDDIEEEPISSDEKNEIEDILVQKFSDDNSELDELMKQELLNEVLLSNEKESIQNDSNPKEETTDDFFTIIDTLTKTINQLEGSETNNNFANVSDGKSINILIDKDDIFSISILNETYEIVADFDGISVLSENIHISTPKKNFYVNIGEKYIEIHNVGTEFTVNTNFEDIEFANALNNITFAKKNNIIELNVKEAFKLSSVNNKIELSMLNTNVAEIKKSNVETSETVNESSICDNRTLLISEETQKVYLPYTIEELMQKLNESHEYQSLEDVIEHEYTVPLSTFKMPIISRFKEAYRFMRTKEHSSVYAALDLAIELMFNSNLNPAVIRAAKDLKELNVYLDCLYENEIEKFDCFKIVYKVLPKIQ